MLVQNKEPYQKYSYYWYNSGLHTTVSCETNQTINKVEGFIPTNWSQVKLNGKSFPIFIRKLHLPHNLICFNQTYIQKYRLNKEKEYWTFWSKPLASIELELNDDIIENKRL